MTTPRLRSATTLRPGSATTGLSDLRPNPGSTRTRKRVGRGPGSGSGKTSGRGEKGQKSRSGFSRKPGFEGGQMPLFRRLPRRGFNNIFRVEYAVLNLQQLELFRAGSTVTPADFVARGFIGKNETSAVKVLGKGKLSKALTVKAHRFSASAKDAIEKAGGAVELIGAKAAA
jgi:large subunit ribosomal protein L15